MKIHINEIKNAWDITISQELTSRDLNEKTDQKITINGLNDILNEENDDISQNIILIEKLKMFQDQLEK